MTDDFHLFGDPGDGDRPIDPDLALMSAYLARELSPMQVLAVEERLATDAAFRARMQPLLDAWAAPVSSLEGGAARRKPVLSDAERERSWRRFHHESPWAGSAQLVTQRRFSMKRAAAVIALVVVPMASLAQVVVHAASNPEARGHAFARRIVAPFTRDASPDAGARLSDAGQLPAPQRSREVDTGALLPVPPGPVLPLESESASKPVPQSAAPNTATLAPNAASARGVAVPTQAQARQPDRARIMQDVRAYHAAVANGDTTADYIVMVMDAAERYVWSTFGSGNTLLEIAGDTRTPAERAAYQREYGAEFRGTGAASAMVLGGTVTGFDTTRGDSLRRYQLGVAEGERRIVVGAATGSSGDVARSGGRGGTVRGSPVASSRTGGDSAVVARAGARQDVQLDTSAEARARLEARLARIERLGTVVSGDSAESLRLRARAPGAASGTGVGAGAGGVAVAAGGGGGGGGRVAIGTALPLSQPGAYRTGYVSTQYGPEMNQAAGMVEPGEGRSGIEGLPAAAVAGADTYVFAGGELAPRPLRVIVVHLVPGATFIPR